MLEYYKKKAKEHYDAWNDAHDSGDEQLANKHMVEYLNYQQKVESVT